MIKTATFNLFVCFFLIISRWNLTVYCRLLWNSQTSPQFCWAGIKGVCYQAQLIQLALEHVVQVRSLD